MRVTGVVALAVTLVGSELGRADDRPFEASGFVGVGVFTDQTELGNSWAPEQVPNSAPVVGARLGWLAFPALTGRRDATHLAAVVEGELSLATAFTGEAEMPDGRARTRYFAPVIGWRAHAMLRLAGHRVVPHLLAGIGGETVASSSPYMSKETDSIFYWGPGVAVAVTGRWQLRLDLRHGVMAARDDGTTSTLEAQLGVVARLGKAPVTRARVVVEPPPPPIDPKPPEPPVEPPPVDLDGDGLTGAADRCPEAAEDFDKFEDDDGCPELDNDHDGLEDARDSCPLLPETRNGVDDADGCPDTIPDDVTKALALGGKLKFETARARVTPAAQATLRGLYLMLLAHPDVLIRITGHPDKAGGDDLAKRRADAVKWWLVDQGVTEGRIALSLGAPLGKRGDPVIELSLRTE